MLDLIPSGEEFYSAFGHLHTYCMVLILFKSRIISKMPGDGSLLSVCCDDGFVRVRGNMIVSTLFELLTHSISMLGGICH